MRLNHCLPPDIRMLAYAQVPPQFDSRFSCIYREYKYFFHADDLEIALVKKCARDFLGLHDFRNFCKKDPGMGFNDDDDEQNFLRRIYQFEILDVGDSVHMAVIKGSAFLWHQVRCMMSCLFMIGRHQESPDIIKDLLDVEMIRERPNYDIADGANLILSDCGFEGIDWQNSNFFADLETYRHIESQVRAAKINTCLLKVLQTFFQGLKVKTANIENEFVKLVDGDHGINLSKPDEIHNFEKVLEAVKIERKVDRRREENMLKNRKRLGEMAGMS